MKKNLHRRDPKKKEEEGKILNRRFLSIQALKIGKERKKVMGIRTSGVGGGGWGGWWCFVWGGGVGDEKKLKALLNERKQKAVKKGRVNKKGKYKRTE